MPISRSMRALAAVVLCATLSVLLQGWAARPVPVTDAPGEIRSLSFNPVGRWTDPERGDMVSPEEIEAAVKRLSPLTGELRTYTVGGGLDAVPRAASREGMKVTLGVWVDGRDTPRTRREMETAVRLARAWPGVVERIIVGNEAVLRGEISADDLAVLMREMRARTRLPVSTGEVTGVWERHPVLAREADFVAAHVLPYWNGVSARHAVRAAMGEWESLQARYPGKRVEIAEFGWPSGRMNMGDARATVLDQASVIREFLVEVRNRRIRFNLIEAFDQPWKTNEGDMGPYWGIIDASGASKFPLAGPVEPDPVWDVRAAVGVLVGAVLGLVWVATRTRWRDAVAAAALAQFAGWGVAWGMDAVMTQYWTPGLLASWIVGVPLLLFLGLASFERLREIADLVMRPAPDAEPPSTHRSGPAPKVSIHVPACRERPEVVRACLSALRAMQWSDLEVLLVLNNTRDEALVSEIRGIVDGMGSGFRLVYAPVLSGHKSGALNLALRETSPDAVFVAVVDADYVVDRDWLQRAVPMMDDPRVAVAQFPQEHFGDPVNPVRDAMNSEYAAFFDAGMAQRAMDDAIIVHGTMLVVRRAALDACGGWDEGHICEDTELGLRLMEAGWSARYSRIRAGRGVLPDDMAGFRRQRDRWVYGGMRIALSHARDLIMPRRTRLSAVQRHHFLMGWTGWIGDAAGLLASVAALGWAGWMILAGLGEPPPAALSQAVILASGIALLHAVLLHLLRVKRGVGAALGAAVVGMSLQAVVGIAVIRGLFVPGLPFRVTPKGGSTAGIARRLRDVRFEAGLLVLQVAAALALWVGNQHAMTAVSLMAATIAIQAIPNLAAVLLAVVEGPRLSSRVVGRVSEEPLSSLPPISARSGASVSMRSSDQA